MYAAYYLNPKFQYQPGRGHNTTLKRALEKVFEKLNGNNRRGFEQFVNEVPIY